VAEPLRVLFCIGVLPTFFAAPDEERAEVMSAIPPAFEDLAGRFGIEVLGTIDDDQLSVGPSGGWPWTAYVLADCPDLDTVVTVCHLVRTTSIGPYRLWRYLRVEARVGRPLFFANG